MKQKVKGVTLVEIILSMAVYAVIALLLCSIMTTINKTMQATSAMDRRVAQEAKFADNAGATSLPADITISSEAIQSVRIFDPNAATEAARQFDFTLDTDGLDATNHDNGKPILQSNTVLFSDNTARHVSDNDNDSHFKFMSLTNAGDTPIEASDLYRFDIKRDSNGALKDMNTAGINSNVTRITKVELTILNTDPDIVWVIKGNDMGKTYAIDYAYNPSDPTNDVLDSIGTGDSLFNEELFIKRPRMRKMAGESAAFIDPKVEKSLEGSIFDSRPEYSKFQVQVVMYALLDPTQYKQIDFGKSSGIKWITYSDGIEYGNIKYLDFTFDLVSHEVKIDPEHKNDANEREFRKSFVYNGSTYNFIGTKDNTFVLSKGSHIDTSVDPPETVADTPMPVIVTMEEATQW